MDAQQQNPSDVTAVDQIPNRLTSDPSFWGATATQFLGAFNDNVFKQLLLLLAVSKALEGATKTDMQGLAMIVFAIPFVLFAGPCGFLSDRFSKTHIIITSKVLEIVAMVMGVAAFFWFDQFGMTGLLFVLGFMGLQSTVFAPSKYGILPELFHGKDLPKVNGVFLMTTFIAIILGTVLAGFLSQAMPDQLWVASLVCVVVAVLGTLTTFPMRITHPSTPDARFQLQSVGIPRQVRSLLWRDRSLTSAMLASCMFWLCAGIVQQAVNSLGKVQLKLGDSQTSILAGAIAVGIAVGCMLAGLLSRGKIEFRLVQLGVWGILACLSVLSLPGSFNGHFLGFVGSLPVLVLLGVFTGMFSVPIQVYLQARAPAQQKGQVLAEMSRANWLAIFISGVLYSAFDFILVSANLPRCYLFGFTMLIMLPVAILYHPKTEQVETEEPAKEAELCSEQA